MPRSLIVQKIKEKWDIVFPHLNEKAIRLWAASEALSLPKFSELPYEEAKKLGQFGTTT